MKNLLKRKKKEEIEKIIKTHRTLIKLYYTYSQKILIMKKIKYINGIRSNNQIHQHIVKFIIN